jgi:hypothetical protein
MRLSFATIGTMDCFGNMLRAYRLMLGKYSADRFWPLEDNQRTWADDSFRCKAELASQHAIKKGPLGGPFF